MLTRLSHTEPDLSGAAVSMKEASFPEPFVSGLEYASPARGGWNIVHQGMLIPEAHQIFVCAEGCLRGVVLTAAEMGAQRRFSMIAVRENNVLDGDMESLIADGTADILKKLPVVPKAVLIYTSCIHHFMGCDLPLVYKTLREKFPEIDFTDCYMNPIMRKSGMTPDQIMRKQLYSLLKPGKTDRDTVDIIGNSFPMAETSDLMRFLRNGKKTVRDITLCRTYEEYQGMAEAAFCISTLPASRAGGEELEKRLGIKHLYLPFCFGRSEIRKNMEVLSNELHIPYDGDRGGEELSERALAMAKEQIGNCAIAIDYTYSPRPLGLARLLLEHGFRVVTVYADAFAGEEKEDFDWLKENAPDLILHPTAETGMRVMPRSFPEKILALGQKAAYFTGSRFFVNSVEAAGLYGFDGIVRMAEDMTEAFLHEKDTKTLIQVKGWGCSSCI